MTCVLSYRRFRPTKMYNRSKMNELSMALGIIEPVDHWEAYLACSRFQEFCEFLCTSDLTVYWLYIMVYTLCEILMPVGNSTWLLGQILALSVSNTVIYYKLVIPIMVYTLCEVLMPVGNSTWLLGQILPFSVSSTVMYYKLVTPISLEPSRAELKRRLYFMVVHHGLHSL